MNQSLLWLKESKVIAIVRGVSSDYMLPLADAFYRGGIRLMEVTFEQNRPETWKDTASAIRTVNENMHRRMLLGAGTVLTDEQLDLACEAGASYIVTPNTNVKLIHRIKDGGLCAFSGAFTPTEIFEAYESGADAVKVFPAGVLGAKFIKAVSAPLNHIPLIAVGNVNKDNAADFFAAGCIAVGVGGNLANKDLIKRGEWDKLTVLARELCNSAE